MLLHGSVFVLLHESRVTEPRSSGACDEEGHGYVHAHEYVQEHEYLHEHEYVHEHEHVKAPGSYSARPSVSW